MESIYQPSQLRSTNNLFRTRSLFVESKDGTPPGKDFLYSLKEFDHPNGYPSMHRIYLESGTEYEAAVKLLGSWEHWLELCRCKWFKPYRDKWEAERKLRDQTLAKKVLVEQTKKGSTTAARALIDYDPDKKRGRPSRGERERILREEKEIEDFLKKAKEKIKVVKGGRA